MRLSGSSIHRKLLLILLIAGFAPALAVVLYNYSMISLGFERLLGGFLQEQAENAALAFDHKLDSYHSEAQRIRDAVETGPLPQSPAPFTTIGIARREGERLVPSDPLPFASIELPHAFAQPGATAAPFVRELPRTTATQNLLFIAPLRSDPNRFLFCLIDSSAIVDSPDIRKGLPSYVYVYSGRGEFLGSRANQESTDIVDNMPAESRSQTAGWASVTEGPGNRSIVGHCDSRYFRVRRNEGMSTAQWTILARLNPDEAGFVVSYIVWKNALLGIVLAPLLILASYFLSRRFVNPIRQLRSQAERISGGDLSSLAKVETGDELEELAEALNSMTVSLEGTHQRLQEEIKTAQTRARQLDLAGNVSRRLTGPFDMPSLFRTTHDELKSLIAFDALTAVLSIGNAPFRRYAYGGDVFAGCTAAELVHLFIEAERQRTADAQESLNIDSPVAQALVHIDFAHCCIIPLLSESQVLGVLALGRKEGEAFARQECELVEQVSSVLAAAVDHISLYEQSLEFAQQLEDKVRARAAELEKAQEQLVQVERFAATGRLAANIAHEINNPLGVIKNYLKIFRSQNSGTLEGIDALSVIEEELDRIARIVRSLLDFYRPPQTRTESTDLNHEIQHFLPLVQAGLRRRSIRSTTELDPNLPRVVLVRDYFRQILLNLFKNAEEAVADGGIICVRTRLDPGTTNPVILEVEDNGCGISDEDKPHIFEPFFSRKTEGKGTGLGLSVTYSIVRSLGGRIEVNSKVGEGTTITICLPARQPDSTSAR